MQLREKECGYLKHYFVNGMQFNLVSRDLVLVAVEANIQSPYLSSPTCMYSKIASVPPHRRIKNNPSNYPHTP